MLGRGAKCPPYLLMNRDFDRHYSSPVQKESNLVVLKLDFSVATGLGV